MTLASRFASKVRRGGPDECWTWRGARTEDGYGRLFLSGGGTTGLPQKMARAHRVAWELANGEIPAGLSVLHRCDNPPCCNVGHLFLGLQADNVKDMYQKRRNRNVGPLGEAAPAAKLTADKVRQAIAGPSSVAAAAAIGISYRHLRQLKTGARWAHLQATHQP
jgi:hypothetical protein